MAWSGRPSFRLWPFSNDDLPAVGKGSVQLESRPNPAGRSSGFSLPSREKPLKVVDSALQALFANRPDTGTLAK